MTLPQKCDTQIERDIRNMTLFNNKVGSFNFHEVTQRCLKGIGGNRILYQTEPCIIGRGDILFFNCNSFDGKESQYIVRLYMYDEKDNLILDGVDSWRSCGNFTRSFLSQGFFSGIIRSSGQAWFNFIEDGLDRVKKIAIQVLTAPNQEDSRSTRLKATLMTMRDKYELINTVSKPVRELRFATAKPTAFIGEVGVSFVSSLGNHTCIFSIKTEVTLVKSNSSIQIKSTTISGLCGIKVGDLIGIDLDNNTTHWFEILSISPGDIGLASEPSSPILVGNTIYISRIS